MNTTRYRTSPAKNTENDYLKQEIKQLREKLYESRRDIIDIMPDEISELLRGYYQCHCYKDLVTWRRNVIKQLIEIASSSALPTVSGFGPRAMCPLCNQGSQSFYETGFSLPLGLERHLEGNGNVYECVVMKTARNLANERLEQTGRPEDFSFSTDTPARNKLINEQYNSILFKSRPPEQLAWAEERLLSLGFSRQAEGNVITWLDERQDWDVYADPRRQGYLQIEVWRRPRRPQGQPSRPDGTFQIPDRYKHDLPGIYAKRLAQAVRDQGGLDKRLASDPPTPVPFRRPDAPGQD